MTDETNTPRELPDGTLVHEYNAPTPDEIAQAKANLRAARESETSTPRTGGVIHPPETIQAATARIRRFLELWDSTEDVVGFTEEFRLDPADLTTVLDALDAYTVPTGFIEFPGPLTEQQYEELKAKWRKKHMATRHDIKVEWVGPPADSDTLLKQVRRWVRIRPNGGDA